MPSSWWSRPPRPRPRLRRADRSSPVTMRLDSVCVEEGAHATEVRSAELAPPEPSPGRDQSSSSSPLRAGGPLGWSRPALRPESSGPGRSAPAAFSPSSTTIAATSRVCASGRANARQIRTSGAQTRPARRIRTSGARTQHGSALDARSDRPGGLARVHGWRQEAGSAGHRSSSCIRRTVLTRRPVRDPGDRPDRAFDVHGVG